VFYENKLIIRNLVFVLCINKNIKNYFTNLYLAMQTYTFQKMTEFIRSKATMLRSKLISLNEREQFYMW
jgi:hypothetical protein